MATGWNHPETNYSNNLHHLPSFPYTVYQAQSLEQSGHYMVAETPNINPSSCSPTGPRADQFVISKSTSGDCSDMFNFDQPGLLVKAQTRGGEMASWSIPLESLNSGWDTTNYSNNLHHLPNFPDTVDQASLVPLHSPEQIGHYMVAGYPETTNNLEYINNPSSCSPTDHYSDMFDVDQLDPVPPSFLFALETNNDPNYFNNLHLQACSNVFPQGITTDFCTGYLQEDHHHHQKVADLPQLFDDHNNSLDPIYPLQLINEPSAISGTQSKYVLGMLDNGVTASQSSEPSSSAGIKGPRSQKWPDEEKTKLLKAIETLSGSRRMWEDIKRVFFNGSRRTTNSLKQKFKGMEKSGSKEIDILARDLAASIRDEKKRNRNR